MKKTDKVLLKSIARHLKHFKRLRVEGNPFSGPFNDKSYAHITNRWVSVGKDKLTVTMMFDEKTKVLVTITPVA